jgi:hypothetical protein
MKGNIDSPPDLHFFLFGGNFSASMVVVVRSRPALRRTPCRSPFTMSQETSMLDFTALSQAIAPLRPLGNTLVKALALIPLMLVAAVLGVPLLVLSFFANRGTFVTELLQRLDHWTSTIVNGATPPRP